MGTLSSSCVESNWRDKAEVRETASPLKQARPAGKTERVSPAEAPEGEAMSRRASWRRQAQGIERLARWAASAGTDPEAP